MHSPGRLCKFFPILCFITCRFLGFASFSRRTPGASTFSKSYIAIFYNVLLVAVIIGLTPSSMISIFQTDYPNKTTATSVIAGFKAALGVVVSIIVWIYVIITQKDAVKIANTWKRTDDTIETLQYLKNCSFIGLELPMYFIINILIWVNIVWTDLVIFEDWFTATFSVITAPTFMLTWLILMYTFLLVLLKERFQGLNEALTHISTVFISCLSVSDLGSTINRDVTIVKRSHEALYEITCDISNILSLPMFFAISAFCATIISSSYFLMTVLIAGGSGLIIYNSVCYLLMESFPIWILSSTVGQVRGEMKRTSIVVNELLRKPFINKKVKAQLELFSMELLHRNVDFTGGCIFALDGTLPHSILNATVTYLIILVQMGFATQNSQSNTTMTPA